MAENDDKERKDRPTNLWFPFLLIMICIIVEYTSSRQLPVQGNLQGPRSVGTETFNVKNARTSLEELTAFGPRVTGSTVNEVTIPQYLQKKLRDLGNALPTGAKLEVERQNPSSNFYLDFLGGITNVSHVRHERFVSVAFCANKTFANFLRIFLWLSFLSTGIPKRDKRGCAPQLAGECTFFRLRRAAERSLRLHPR